MIDAENTLAQMRALLNEQNTRQAADILGSTVATKQEVRSITFDCSTAKLATAPYELTFPFTSFIVTDATDSNVAVNLYLGTQDSYQDPLPLKKGASFSLPHAVRRAYVSWAAQSGKTMTIVFLVSGTFSTNTLNLVNSGGVSIADGDSLATQASGSSSTTAAALFAADTTRKGMVIQNQGATDIWLGDSAVTDDTGAKPGIKVPAGGSYDWKSTAGCYVVSKVAVSPISLTKFS